MKVTQKIRLVASFIGQKLKGKKRKTTGEYLRSNQRRLALNFPVGVALS
jgi:hypothetical protein